MTMSREDRLYETFNKAVARFWRRAAVLDRSRECLYARIRLTDAADKVLLGRDELRAAQMPADRRETIMRDVEKIRAYLTHNRIDMLGAPTTSTTGRMTYRILNKPRFDA